MMVMVVVMMMGTIVMCSSYSPNPKFLRTFYVSSSIGNDTNNGTSPGSPWQSINRVNRVYMHPGMLSVSVHMRLHALRANIHIHAHSCTQ